MVNAASRRFPVSSLVLRRQLRKLYETIRDEELRNKLRDARMILRIVPQARVMVVERFGSFLRLAYAGPQIFVPFLDRPRRVYWTGMPAGLTQIDLCEHSTDLQSQPLITKDNVTITVDSTVFWQIVDPIKAVYKVGDLTGHLIQLSLAALRKVVGQLELNYALSSVEMINTRVRQILDEPTHQWGVKGS
jgi:regulator of protease activity HflC (stomatin/prohibitin superfamily)